MTSVFHSARLKLTAFYLAVLLCFSLALTGGIRTLAQHEYERSSSVQGGVVRRLYTYFYNLPTPGEAYNLSLPPNDFSTVQQNQDDLVRQHLNEDLIMLNIGALLVGGVLSYWYAGRTLKPIVEAHDAQKRFASDASHELRTPLANMQVENEVFLRQKSFTESEARELIGSNLEEVQRLESLANNLLSLAQYEQTSLQLAPVAIQKIVDNALAHADKSLETHRVTVDKTMSNASVVGHRESLERLVSIIIDNAIKYGPEKGTIHIKGRKSSGQYLLSIHDEGPGISQEDLPHIFDRLYRGDKARSSKAGGYGLGLALAKSIAVANKASITASNKKPGALFTVEMPLAKK
jgi:two-component system, OmpR family, sensor histidine kinase CiaH